MYSEIQNWKESYTWIIIITVPFQKYFETIKELAKDGILKTSVVKSFWILLCWSYQTNPFYHTATEHVKSLQPMLSSKEPEFSAVMSKSFS